MKFKFNPLDWAMVAIAALVIGSIIFQSCNGREETQQEQVSSYLYGIKMNVVTIDSCEYVVTRYYQHSVSVVHKQNCRYCLERASKLNVSKWGPVHILAPDGDSAIHFDIDTTKIYQK